MIVTQIFLHLSPDCDFGPTAAIRSKIFFEKILTWKFPLPMYFSHKETPSWTFRELKKFSGCQNYILILALYSSECGEHVSMSGCEVWTNIDGDRGTNVKIFKTPPPVWRFEITAFISNLKMTATDVSYHANFFRPYSSECKQHFTYVHIDAL